MLPAGFVEGHGKLVHLKAEDEKDKIRQRLFHTSFIGDDDNDNDKEFV